MCAAHARQTAGGLPARVPRFQPDPAARGSRHAHAGACFCNMPATAMADQ
ncbi:hypothetical protein OH687_35180 [Burkholderia anthina]|nr:hypothetical protein OH687_35180 [Burkholderia anthina]